MCEARCATVSQTALPVARRSRLDSLGFSIAGAVLLAIGVFISANWVGTHVRAALLQRAAIGGARYAQAVVAREVQDAWILDSFPADRRAALMTPIDDGLVGDDVVSLKIWNADGRIVYSSNPANIGREYPVTGYQARAWAGESVAHVSDLTASENVNERAMASRLLETYSPVRQADTGQIVAVAELYERVDQLDRDVAAAERHAALLSGATALPVYVVVVMAVRRRADKPAEW